jgi:23S rRNA (adenine2503-C2)-methyltransferase
MMTHTLAERQNPTAPVRLPRNAQPSLYELELHELAEFLEDIGQPAYRARQIYGWAYDRLETSWDPVTVLPKDLRAELEDALPITTLTPVREVEADGGDTIKLLFRTHDGQHLETVLMFYSDRVTVCVSCQIGCAVGCSFCATGMSGLTRNLTAGEMVGQVVFAARRAIDRGRQLTNLVMMGMGEPFQNYAATMKMARILNDPHGMQFGARRMTISTSGLVPFIDRLAEEPVQVKLAVSLHAPNNELRDVLVPLNRRWPVEDLIAACRRYVAQTGRRMTFEYCLIKGVNDSDQTANELADLLDGLLCHVNVIPLNPTPAADYQRPSEARINRFANVLRERGISTTVRYSRGVDIAAACGQLRADHESATA